jgi:Allophanate hydrolase subunit 2
MDKPYFEILRSGTNTTYQDNGRPGLYHMGIPFSGAMDKRNFFIANKLVGNELKSAVIEFAFQGPLLKLKNSGIIFTITGNVNFNIIRKNSNLEKGICYKTYNLQSDDQIDIISTVNSVYGYLSVKGGFEIELFWDSYSVNTKAKIGPNDGEKFSNNQKILIKKNSDNFSSKKINYVNSKIEFIRLIKKSNYNYFSEKI